MKKREFQFDIENLIEDRFIQNDFKTAYQLFEEQAARVPGRIALEFGDKSITYEEQIERPTAWLGLYA